MLRTIWRDLNSLLRPPGFEITNSVMVQFVKNPLHDEWYWWSHVSARSDGLFYRTSLQSTGGIPRWLSMTPLDIVRPNDFYQLTRYILMQTRMATPFMRDALMNTWNEE